MSFWCEQGPVPITSSLLWSRYQPYTGVGWESPATWLSLSLLLPFHTSPLGAEDQFICQHALPGSLSKLLLALCVLSSGLRSCFLLGRVWRANGPEVAESFETPKGKHWRRVMR